MPISNFNTKQNKGKWQILNKKNNWASQLIVF